MGRLNYTELAKARIKEKRNVVISEAQNLEGETLGYTVAEQLVTEEEGKERKVFLRGGLGIMSEDGLRNLKVAVDEALKKVSEK